MSAMLILGLIWTVYGFLGRCGIQNIPKEYRGHEWTEQYIRSLGTGHLMIGIPCFILDAVAHSVDITITIQLMLILTIALESPGLIYLFVTMRKYKALYKSEEK